MGEYVEKDEVLDRLYEEGEWTEAISHTVYAMPAADVVEVKHGRWEYHDCVCTGDGLVAVYACSNCRFCIDEEVFEQLNATDFCNCCGARMDGEG